MQKYHLKSIEQADSFTKANIRCMEKVSFVMKDGIIYKNQ